MYLFIYLLNNCACSFLNLALINQWNGLWYHLVLVVCAFLTGAHTEGSNLKKKMFDVCVHIFCLIKICVRTGFVDFREFVV